ncbi:MAG: CHAT domain-containing protein, partial [Bacteroidetes bacterium]|nr:CHAT domain-containing protein [Bacteroidota bacterium]
MRQLILLLLVSLLLGNRGLCGTCPDRPLLRETIARLKSAKAAPDSQLQQLLPFIPQLEACPQPQDSTFAFLLQRIGALYYLKNDVTNAVSYTQRAIRLLGEKCPSTAPPYLVKWYHFLVIFFNALHEKKEFLSAIDSSLSIALRNDLVSYNVVFDHWQKTGYYYDIGDYDRCFKSALFNQSLIRKYGSGDDSIHLVLGCLTHMYNSLHQLGKYEQEEQLLKTSIDEFTAIKNEEGLGMFLNQLSLVYQQKHRYKDALDCLKQSYAFYKKINYQLGCSEALNNSGYIYLWHVKDYPQALAYCRRALACLPERRSADSLAALEALNDYDNIACAQTALGRLDSALFYFQKAFDQLQPGMNETTLLHSTQAQGYDEKRADYIPNMIIHKGDVYYRLYRQTGRREHLSEAIRVYKMADLFLERIKVEQAERLSQLVFRRNARSLYEHALRAALAKNDAGEAFYFFERSRAILLDDQLQQQAALDDNALASRAVLRKKIRKLEKEMEGVSPDIEEYAKLQTDLFAAGQELDRFDQHLRKPGTSIATDLVSLSDLQRHLGRSGSSFLELYAGDSAVYSLLVTPRTALFKAVDITTFDTLALVYGNYIADPERLNRDMPGFVRTSNQLYHLLFPIDSVPPGRFMISPAGTYFPFEALVVNTSPKHPIYFLEDHPVCYTYSARYLLDTADQTSPKEAKQFMGMAPVQYASYLHLPDLPGSNGSLDQIASWFGRPDKFTTTEASKASFLQNFSSYRLIQLYTHAVGNIPGKEPLIYFADSALALSELIPEKKPSTRIIVLSACETANGEFFQ